MAFTLFYQGNINTKIDGDADQFAGKLWAGDWNLIADVVNRPIIETGQTNFVDAITTLTKPRKPPAGMFRVYSKSVPQFILPTQTNVGSVSVDFYGTNIPLTYYDGSPIPANALVPYEPLTVMWNGVSFYITRSSLSVSEIDMPPTAIIGTSFGYSRTRMLADIDTTLDTPSYIVSPPTLTITYILFMTRLGYAMVKCENNTITSMSTFLKTTTIGTTMVVSNEHNISPIAIIGTNVSATELVLFTPTNVTEFTSGVTTIQSPVIPNYIENMNDTIFGNSFGTLFINGNYKKIGEFGNGTPIWHDHIGNKMKLGDNLLMNGFDYYNQKMQTRTPLQTIATNIVNHKPLAILNDGHLFNHLESGDAYTQTSAMNKQTFDNLGSVPFPIYFTKTYPQYVADSPLFYEDGNYKGCNYHVEDNMDVGIIFSYASDNIPAPMINKFFDFGTCGANRGYIRNGYASKMLLPTKTTAGQSMIGILNTNDITVVDSTYLMIKSYSNYYGNVLASKTKIYANIGGGYDGVLMTGTSTHLQKYLAFVLNGTTTGRKDTYSFDSNGSSYTFTVSDYIDSYNIRKVILPARTYGHRYALATKWGNSIIGIYKDDSVTFTGTGAFAFGLDHNAIKEPIKPNMDYGNIVSCKVNPTTGRPNIVFDDSLYLYWDGSDYVIKVIDMGISTPLDKKTVVDVNGNQITLMKNGDLHTISPDGEEGFVDSALDVQGGIYLKTSTDVYKDGVLKYAGNGDAYGTSSPTGYGVYCFADGVYFENGDVFVSNTFIHIELSTIQLAHNGTNVLVQYDGNYIMVKADGTIATTVGMVDDPVVLVPHETVDYWFVYNTTTEMYETFPASTTLYTNMLNGFGEVVKPDMIAYTDKHVILAHEDGYYFKGDNTNFVIKNNIEENVTTYKLIARRIGLDLTYSSIDVMYYTYKGTLRAIGEIDGTLQTAMIVDTNPFKGNIEDVQGYVTTDSFNTDEIYSVRGGYLRMTLNTKFGDVAIGTSVGGFSSVSNTGNFPSVGVIVDSTRGYDSKFITKYGEIFNDRYNSSVDLDTVYQGNAYSLLRTSYDATTYGDPIVDGKIRRSNTCHVYVTSKGYVIYQGTLADIPGNATCALAGTELDQHDNGYPFRLAIAGFNKIYVIDKDYKVRVFSNTETWTILDTTFTENAIDLGSLYDKEGLTVLAGDKKLYAISPADAYLSGNLDEKLTFTVVSDPLHEVVELHAFHVTAYLTSDNRLFICGLGANGRLCTGDSANRATFAEVFASYIIKRVVLGYYFTAIVKDDGEIRWGGQYRSSPFSTSTSSSYPIDVSSFCTGFTDQCIDSEQTYGIKPSGGWRVFYRYTYYNDDMDETSNPHRTGFIMKTHIGWRLVQGKGSIPLNEDVDDRFISNVLSHTSRGTPIASPSSIYEVIQFTHQSNKMKYEFIINGTGSYLRELGLNTPAILWDYDTSKFGYDIKKVYGSGSYCIVLTNSNNAYFIGELNGHRATHFVRIPVVGVVKSVVVYPNMITVSTSIGVYTITNTTQSTMGNSHISEMDGPTEKLWNNCTKTEGTLNEHILDVVTKTDGSAPDLTLWMKPYVHSSFV